MLPPKPRTDLDRFLFEHRDVVACAAAHTAHGPVLIDTVLEGIARATGKDELTVRQALYSAGRLWYEFVVPANFFSATTPTERLALREQL